MTRTIPRLPCCSSSATAWRHSWRSSSLRMPTSWQPPSRRARRSSRASATWLRPRRSWTSGRPTTDQRGRPTTTKAWPSWRADAVICKPHATKRHPAGRTPSGSWPTPAAQLESGREQWEAGKADYDEGLASYEDARAEADAQLAEAQQKLDDAQRAIDDLEAPTWYVMDRHAELRGGPASSPDADRVDSIASVFPFIFFLVAALVALTTMTRMVEEERVLIGTYKALGYARWRIASKYLAYAALATVAGSAVGIAVLSQVLPRRHPEGLRHHLLRAARAAAHRPRAGGACGRLGRGRHAGGHVGRRHGDAARKPGAAHAPRAPRRRASASCWSASGPLWRRLSFLLEGHVPQPVPLQEALRHDHGGHRGLHGACC